jgi:hypothetical protein
MTGNFTFNNTIFAELDFSGINGQPGLGFYRLMAEVKVNMHGRAPTETIAVSNFTADLSVRGAGNAEHFVGRMWRQGADEPLTASQYAWTPSVLFELDLDAHRLEAMESIRLGGGLNLKLWLYGRAIAASGRVETVKADLYLPANQSTWIAALDGMGYRRTLLLEIPMPAQDAPEGLTQAVEHLREAQDLMMHGRYRDAVGRCRDVLESLDGALGDSGVTAPSDQRDWDKACRVRHARKALKVLTQPARHADQVSTQHEWGPEDAASVVTAIAALLRLATQG